MPSTIQNLLSIIINHYYHHVDELMQCKSVQCVHSDIEHSNSVKVLRRKLFDVFVCFPLRLDLTFAPLLIGIKFA